MLVTCRLAGLSALETYARVSPKEKGRAVHRAAPEWARNAGPCASHLSQALALIRQALK
jgi:hypothetical protein